jgi:uncharacterized membrane protein YhaH (DUF805 family)
MNLIRLCFSFFGRVSRKKFWIGFGIAYGMMALATIYMLGAPENIQWLPMFFGVWMLTWIVALLALATKRLHDLGISGWWLLGFMIVCALLVGARQEVLTSIASVALFVGVIWLGSAKGTEGANRFGPSPLLSVPNAGSPARSKGSLIN